MPLFSTPELQIRKDGFLLVSLLLLLLSCQQPLEEVQQGDITFVPMPRKKHRAGIETKSRYVSDLGND
jgi:hypothetical protein